MKNKAKLFIGGVLLLLMGCATLPNVATWNNATVTSKCAVERDDFKKVTSVLGPDIYFGGNNDAVTYSFFRFVAARRDGEQPYYYVRVETQRGYGLSWAFWREAYDQAGTKFPLSDDARNVVAGGIVREICSSPVERSYFENIKQTGIKWKIYGDHAESSFTLATNLVQGFLIKCDEQFK